MKLRNKTALVAGATREIGRAIARKLASRGVRLVLPWYDDWQEDARTLREEFGGEGHILIRADLRREEDVAAVIAKLKEKTESLDILVNNIERGGMPVVHGSYDKEINHDQWQLEMDTTLLAKKLLFEASLPLLRNSGQASVINISSIAGIIGRSGPAGMVFSDGYAAANRAVSSFTQTWARLGSPSVRVNELMLGLIDGRHGRNTRGWKTMTKKAKQELLDHTLLSRTGLPDEVADAVLFLVEKGEYITGAVIRIDGGYILGGEKAGTMPRGIL